MSAGTALHWHWEVQTVFPMAAFGITYISGVARLWSKAGPGRGISFVQALAFAGGMFLLVLSLCSPLAALAERLFSAHMVVHELLMAAAAPLFIAARPFAALAWALPAPPLRLFRPWRLLASPLVATLQHAAVIWVWHIPWAFRAAMASEALHVLQHVTFLLSALLFWQTMDQLAQKRAGSAVGYLFATSLHTEFLGALLMLSPRLWFPAPGGFGLSPLEDQQLAGAIMWMPGGMIYAALALVQAGRWVSGPHASPMRAKPGPA
jgi:cytochrome c oxidase assembly factor CtaG